MKKRNGHNDQQRESKIFNDSTCFCFVRLNFTSSGWCVAPPAVHKMPLPFLPKHTVQYSIWLVCKCEKLEKKKSLIYDREQCDRKTKWLSSIRISYFNFQLPSKPTNQRRAWLHFKSFHPPNCIHVCLKNKTSWCSLYCIWIEHFRYLKGSLMHSQPPGF